jgi:hypothetical protein
VRSAHSTHITGQVTALCSASSSLLYFTLLLLVLLPVAASVLLSVLSILLVSSFFFHTPILIYRLLPSVYSHSSPFLSFPFSLFFNHSCLNFIPYVFLLSLLCFQSYSFLHFSTSILFIACQNLISIMVNIIYKTTSSFLFSTFLFLG